MPIFTETQKIKPLKFSDFIVYILTLQNALADFCDISQKHCDFRAKEQQGEEDMDMSKAVVLYSEDAILPLHKQSRTFNFVSKEIVIKQEWKKLGVAAVVWDAAEVLSSYLEQHSEIVKDKSVIELGAGTGLVGMVAALLGGLVTITDREEVLDYLHATVNDNLPPETFQNTKVQALDWTKPADDFEQRYDVILGADIVYIEEVFDDLLQTLHRLSDKDTLIYLSCRIRYDRDTNFLQRLEETFVVEKILYHKEMDVNLYKVIKK